MAEPSRDQIMQMGATAAAVVADFHHRTPGRPGRASANPLPATADRWRPPNGPGDFTVAAKQLAADGWDAVDTLSPYDFAHVPSGGNVTAAFAELLAAGMNRFTGVAAYSPALVKRENDALRWWAEQFGLPDTAGGVVTTSGSLATLNAVIAARLDRLGEDPTGGVMYVSDQAHHSVMDAARYAGVMVRVVPTSRRLRMLTDTARVMIEADRAAGRRPFAIVGTMGTTDTGTVDPLGRIAALARQYELWAHGDAAAAGGFILTEPGFRWADGIARFDSITFDPHKSLSYPYGTAMLLVADAARTRAAMRGGRGGYMPEASTDPAVPDFSAIGLDLTREYRGARLTLPMDVDGLPDVTRHLTEKLELAHHAYRRLVDSGLVEVSWPPTLSTVTFAIPGDRVGLRQARLVAWLDGQGIRMTGTRVKGCPVVRMCVMSHRTHLAHVDHTVDRVLSWLRGEAG